MLEKAGNIKPEKANVEAFVITFSYNECKTKNKFLIRNFCLKK